MSNGQTLCGIKVELAMFSTCTNGYYPFPLEILTSEHRTNYYDLPGAFNLTNR